MSTSYLLAIAKRSSTGDLVTGSRGAGAGGAKYKI